MTRKLVTIRSIKEVKPIEGADRIALAIIDGWQCVVQKTEFQTGDLCAYFEIDSFCAIRPEFEFLRKSCFRRMADGKEGFRLRTIKLRGQLSQGLAMPIKTFPELKDAKLGDEVTELLGVTKYEPPMPACLGGKARGLFPSFVKKTDEERIQNLPDWFERYKDMEWEVTEKLDGTSCTIYHRDGDAGVCSRNLDLVEDDNTLWTVAKRANIIESLKAYYEKEHRNIAIQGECIGEGINKNPYLIKGQKLYVFNIFDIDKGRLMTPEERTETMKFFPGLEQVPVIGSQPYLSLYPDVDALLKFASASSVLNPKTQREGLVFKSRALVGAEIISFKVVSNDYLMDYSMEET